VAPDLDSRWVCNFLAAVAALLLWCGAADAAGPHRPFQTGLWSGGAYTDDRSGRFSHCSAGVVYDSGTNMFIVGTEAHGWWLGFTNPQWSLTPGASIPVTLQFDRRAPVELSGTATNAQLLLVAIPDDSHLIDTFRRSSQLSVIARERSFSLQLGGAAAVMSELTSCVRSSMALETPLPAAPPAPPPAPALASPSPAPAPPSLPAQNPAEPEEIRLARNFVSAAGLPNAHLIDTDKPAALASFRAVWKSENTAGAVRIIPPGPEATGLRIASELISVDPLLCKGNFSAARSSEAIDGNIVFSAVLSCADALNERITQFFIAPRAKGGFAVFAVIGDYPDRAAATDRQKLDMLNKAAIQAVGPEALGG
jgi:hypothetical protein